MSGDMARVPVCLLDSDGLEVDAPWMSLLTRNANQYQTAFEFKQWMVATALLEGTAAAYIRRDLTTGEPISLVPLQPGRVIAHYTFQDISYRLDGEVVDPDELLILFASHTQNRNPYWCTSPLTQCASSLALALLQERAAAAASQFAASGKIAIMHPGQLTPEAKMSIIDSYERKHGTPDGVGRPLVVDEGIKIERISPSPNEIGLRDDRRHSIMDVARVLGIPPNMLFQGDSGALNSEPEIMRQYVSGTLSSWAARFGAQMTTKLAQPGQRVVFEVSKLARGSVKETAYAIRIGVGEGVITPNEARAIWEFPAIDGGDELKKPAPLGDSVLTEDEGDSDGF